MKKQDGGRALTHLRAVTAPRAWAWKVAQPTSKELALTDTQYRVSARLNLGLRPGAGTDALPDTRPMCNVSSSIRDNSWHFLSCSPLFGRGGQVTARHDDVGRALYRCALAMGLRVQREVVGLDASTQSGRPWLSAGVDGPAGQSEGHGGGEEGEVCQDSSGSPLRA